MRNHWGRYALATARCAALCLTISVTVDAEPLATAAAPQAPLLRWDESDAGPGWSDVAFLGVAGAVAVAGLIIEPDVSDPWRATLGVDEDVRNGLRLTGARARRAARTTSDVLAGVMVTYPLLVEAGFNAAWAKSSPRVGLEMGVMHLEVLGLTAALVNTTKWIAGRERPYGRLCGTELSATSADCAGRDRYASYFSGHAAFTFASASALCMQHVRWNLWGNATPWIACSTSYALAATTALLRVGADRHYVSDITTGAIVGATVGLLVPWFHGSRSSRDDARTWRVGLTGNGVNLGGVF